MPSMVIERIGTCNDCNRCSEKRVVLPGRMFCGVGRNFETIYPSAEYAQCTIRFRIKSWDLPYPLITQEIAGMRFLNPITITSQDRDIFPPEFTVEVQGSCNRCGFCCGFQNNKLVERGCSHVITKGPNKGECSIYSNLSDYCSEHGDDHSDCIPLRSMPMHLWNTACGYSFIVTTPGLPITGNEILRFYLVPPSREELPTDGYITDIE